MFRSLRRRFCAQEQRAVALASAALLVAGGLAACGGSDDASGGSGDTLKIAVSSPIPQFAPVYLAEVRGYFKDEGLDVQIDSGSGAGSVTMLAGGQVDLAYGGVAQSIAMAQSKPVSILLSTTGGFGVATIVAGPGIETVDDLEGKRIGTPGTGSVDSYARLYNKRLGLNAELVPFTTPAALVGAVKAGQVDAGAGPESLYADVIADGSVHVVLKVGDPEATEALGTITYPEGAMYAVKDVAEDKHDQMVKFVSALLRATADLKSEDPAELAKALKKHEAFANTPLELLTANLTNDIQYILPTEGEITADNWDYALEQYKDWEIIKGSDIPDSITYDQLIDMSVLDDASKAQ
jgi:ABC-type nitrate/sulfonate/bicarbonate transport system substrate-binding protein